PSPPSGAARGGVLVKDRLALERMRTVDTVLFDKTGTLTEGRPAVTALAAAGPHTEEELLALAAAAEAASEHPLARAVVAAATERGLPVPLATGFSAAAAVGGRAVAVGGPDLLTGSGLGPLPVSEAWSARGDTVL